MPKVSIIIPVYNVEEYLPKCLDSIINQTLTDIEAICVDDGSTDSSLDVLKFYAKNDTRIKLITQKNNGVSVARNKGLDAAAGEYIMFLDSDDWLEPEACETAYNEITSSKTDMVVFNYYYINNDKKNKSKIFDFLNDTEVFDFKDCSEDFYYTISGCWNKIYKHTKNLPRFIETFTTGEDAVFYWQYCLGSNPKIKICNTPLYNYRLQKNSVSHNVSIISGNKILDAINYLVSTDLFKNAPLNTQAKILDRFAKTVYIKLNNQLNNVKLPKSYYKGVENFIKLFNHYPQKIKNTLRFYDNLKKALTLKKYEKIIALGKKIFSVTPDKQHNIINITFIRIKIKKNDSETYKIQQYIDRIKKNQKKYPKDTYILFDSLYDILAESIDAYTLFEQMKSMGMNVYYAIVKDSPLYKKLLEQDKMDRVIVLKLPTKDCRYEFLRAAYDQLVRAKCVITSFSEGMRVDKFLKNNPYWKYIFIQHGTIFMKEGIMYNGYLYPEKYDKFLISSKYEYNIFRKYGWKDNQLIKCGLPRWDLLPKTPPKDIKEKSIFVMFTYRNINSLKFEDSLYRKNIIKLFSNDSFIDYLKKHNIKIYYASHHAMLTSRDINFTINNDYIEYVGTNRISEFIKKSSCLLTDFSSVAFDFMFQNKPVICYLMDKNDPLLPKDEREDIKRFDYKKYIIPNVFYDEASVINKIKYYVENDFEIEPDVKDKYNKFFYTKENISEKLALEIKKICKD